MSDVSTFTEKLVHERTQAFGSWFATVAMGQFPANITSMDIQFQVTYDDGVVSQIGMRLDSAGWAKEAEG